MKKTRLILLSALTALSLTSCSLFNDDDIVIENHFKTKEEASAPKASEATAGGVDSRTETIGETEALVFKSVVYSNMADNKIENTYKGLGFDVNNNEDYGVNIDNNNFDLYVPKGLKKDEDQTVVLFIHGGAWVSGLKTHVNPYVKEFTKRGYISATIEYTLLNRDFENEHKDLSVFRDLDEIDACIKTMKDMLVELGFTGSLSLVIGGVSSGAHLTMLYSYSRGTTSPLPIKFVLNAVGPTDIQSSVWKAFKYSESEQEAYEAALEAGIDKTAIEAREGEGKLKTLGVAGADYDWNEYRTMEIANGMAAFPYSPTKISSMANEGKTDVADPSDEAYKKLVSNDDSAEKLLSVTHYITSSNKIPMLCAYAGQDTIVGIGQFANLQKHLDLVGYSINADHSGTTYSNNTYEFYYFKNCGHVNLDSDEAQYNALLNRVEVWLKA